MTEVGYQWGVTQHFKVIAEIQLVHATAPRIILQIESERGLRGNPGAACQEDGASHKGFF
jgi:hypothetical protein